MEEQTTTYTTTRQDQSFIISTIEPYLNVVEISDFEVDITPCETENLYYQKYYRWSTDNVTYTDWIPLNQTNLKNMYIDPEMPLYIEYKFIHMGRGNENCETHQLEHTLTFNSIGLTITQKNGLVNLTPYVSCSSNKPGECGHLNFLTCDGSSGFNPYANRTNLYNLYYQMSATISNMFGICVQYFKTAPDLRSRDIILKEYSLRSVFAQAFIKILVPENQMPTRAIQFNQLMMDAMADEFEVHIVKSTFRQVFGANSHPDVGDYLYIQTYMNKVYKINAVSETDDMLDDGAYWRVALVTYEQSMSTSFETQELIDKTNELIFSEEFKFKEEREREEKDVRKDNQYNTISTQSYDYTRRILNRDLSITEEDVCHGFYVISRYHYALKSLISEKDTIAVRLKYTKGWTKDESRAISFWFRFKGNPIDISERYGTCESAESSIAEKSSSPTEKLLVVSEDSTEHMSIQLNRESGISITFGENALTFYEDHPFDNERWYGVIININNAARLVSMNIYTLNETERKPLKDKTSNYHKIDSRQSNVFSIPEPIEILGASNESELCWDILPCNVDFTNFRLWNKPIEEENQRITLQANVVSDTHLCEILDNATPQLSNPRVMNPR